MGLQQVYQSLVETKQLFLPLMSMRLTIIFLKEAYSVATGNDTSALILQQEPVRSLQDDGIVSMAFQCHACEEPAKRAADLLCISWLLQIWSSHVR
jgi:hypothetical protein